MLTKRTHLGDIIITKQFFSELIGRTIIGCFGVVEMNDNSPKETFLENMRGLPFFKRKNRIDKGVSFKIAKDKLYVELHITVMYGVNVASIVKSIQNKIKFAIEDEVGIPVDSVCIFVDKIKT